MSELTWKKNKQLFVNWLYLAKFKLDNKFSLRLCMIKFNKQLFKLFEETECVFNFT